MVVRAVTVKAGELRVAPRRAAWNGVELDLGRGALSASIVLGLLADQRDEVLEYDELARVSKLSPRTVQVSVWALGRAVGPGTGGALEVDVIHGGRCQLATVPVPPAAHPPRPDLTHLVLTVRAAAGHARRARSVRSDRLEVDHAGWVASWNRRPFHFHGSAGPGLLRALAASAGHCVPWTPLAERSGMPKLELLDCARNVRRTLSSHRIRSVELLTIPRRGLMLAPARGHEFELSWEPWSIAPTRSRELR